jgi:hypothetical protein
VIGLFAILFLLVAVWGLLGRRVAAVDESPVVTATVAPHERGAAARRLLG